MKTSEILSVLQGGETLAIGEFRGFEARALPNGNTIICSSFVLVGRESLPVESFAPKGSTIEQAKALGPKGLKVGDTVAVKLTERFRDKYGTHARGSVEPLTKD